MKMIGFDRPFFVRYFLLKTGEAPFYQEEVQPSWIPAERLQALLLNILVNWFRYNERLAIRRNI
jgi:hypothetical protein